VCWLLVRRDGRRRNKCAYFLCSCVVSSYFAGVFWRVTVEPLNSRQAIEKTSACYEIPFI
jgi:hypothetical protein